MKVREGLLAGARGFWLAVSGAVTATVLFSFTVVSAVLILLGVGLFTTPLMLRAVRAHANQCRAQALDWSGVRIPVPYGPPPVTRDGFLGRVELCLALLKDRTTWRDAQWLLVQMTGGILTAILPAVLLVYAIWGPVLAFGVWKPIVNAGGNEWFAFIHITDQTSANMAAGLGLALGVLGLFVNPRLLRFHFGLAAALLRPTRETELARRVDRLTETRYEAVDSSAAELRRIERDLHDGAQARLVAMGMSLGTIEALMEKDPAEARRLLAAARAGTAETLTELRDLVRGIHPPVLAERGLADAVRALALRLPLAVEVDVELAGRAAEPVESAAYFAISEALTNAAKHSGAERIWLDVRHVEGTLRIAVTDNGRGGADPAGGTGLRGIERRLGAFDGLLAVNSPVGGPTMVTMEIPCVLTR
ncbi:sensor domain-containing protein [Streptomyces sp. NPDC037389]|uniref:sensor histidine kinase n=1 Tax=Streptomyces sp. NPDC037389 TaxID=3155369 RepID=UPI0033C5D41E